MLREGKGGMGRIRVVVSVARSVGGPGWRMEAVSRVNAAIKTEFYIWLEYSLYMLHQMDLCEEMFSTYLDWLGETWTISSHLHFRQKNLDFFSTVV